MAKSAQQIIRESVRRVLREAAPAAKKPTAAPAAAPGDKLKLAIFGDTKSGDVSDFYAEVAARVPDPATDGMSFVFTPSADRKTISATVTKIGSTTEDAAKEIETLLNVGKPDEGVPSVLSKISPDAWSDIAVSWPYNLGAKPPTIIGGEMDLTKEARMISEKWMRIAGLLKEAPEEADRPAAERAVKKYLAGGHKDIKAAQQALADALAAAGFETYEEIEELLSRHTENSVSLARDLVKLLPKKK